jgi:hypothetical protein
VGSVTQWCALIVLFGVEGRSPTSMHRLHPLCLLPSRLFRLIDDIDEEVTTVQSRMDAVLGQISKLIQTKSKCQLWTIIFLIVVLISVTLAAFL